VLQATDYYAFGMEHTPLAISNTNRYLFNGKELQDETFAGGVKLGWYDYGARFYDPELGRWHSPDPMSELYYSWSPYAYVRNNPLLRIDPTGKWDVTVHLYNNRKQHGYGVAIVTDRNGNEVYRFDVRAEGTGGRNRKVEKADTPLGVYDIPNDNAWITSGNRKSFGPNARLNMTPLSGEVSEITTRDLTEIRIHGGRQETYDPKTKKWTAVPKPTLSKTWGCLRAYDTDMATFKQTTDNLQANDSKESPGQVTVVDDLEKVETPENLVESNSQIKGTYRVPESEQDYWHNYVNNLLNGNGGK